jgi:ribonuclease P protein component
MLSKKNRIPRKDLEQITIQKECFFGELFNLKVSKNSTNKGQASRFAIICSKKNFKTAVKRHFIKRKFNSAIRFFLNKFSGGDYVFFLKKGVEQKTFRELKKELEGFISKNSL